MLSNILKWSFIILFFSTQYSCIAKKGVKKIENQVKSILENKKDITNDTDGDLIDNSKEIEIGSNPTIPNVPTLKIDNVQKLIFSLKMKKNNETKNVEIISSIRPNDDLRDSIFKISQEWLTSALDKIHYETILPTKPSLDLNSLLRMSDLSAIPLQKKAFFEYSDLLDDGWKLISGSVKTEMQVKGEGIEHIANIDKISLSMGVLAKRQPFTLINTYTALYNSSGTPLILNNNRNEGDVSFENIVDIYSSNVDVALLEKILKAQANIAFFINDFRVQRLGESYTYSELFKSVSEKNTKVLIKDNGKINTLYTLKNKTIKEFFNSASIPVTHDSSFNLTGLYEKESSLRLPISSNDIENQELSSGNWRILNGDLPLNTNLSTVSDLVISYVNVEDIKGASDSTASLKTEHFNSRDTLSLYTSTNSIFLVTLNLSKKEDFTEQGENAISKTEEVCDRPRRGSGRPGRDSDNDTPPSCRNLNYSCHVVWNTLKTKTSDNVPFNYDFLDIDKGEYKSSMETLKDSDVFIGGNGRMKIFFKSSNELRNEPINVSVKNSKTTFPLKIGNRHLQKNPIFGNCGSPLDFDEKPFTGAISYTMSGEILTLNHNSYFELVD